MSEVNSKISIVLGADDAYALPLAVTLYSILKNVNQKNRLHFYILDGGLSEGSKKRITNICQRHNNGKNEVEWIRSDVDSIQNLPLHSYQTTQTYLRFLISELLPSHLEKVIWLDCDLIFETDITTLWQQNLNGSIAGAVRSLLIQTLDDPQGITAFTKYGGQAKSPYFNAGVMVINMELWKKEQISKKAISYLQENRDYLHLNSQEALNAVLIGKWSPLNPRWNQQGPVFWPQILPETEFTQSLLKMYDELTRHPFIIHYMSSGKPWDHTCMHPLAHRFLYYLRESGWFTSAEWKLWWYRYYLKRLRWLWGDLKETLNQVKGNGDPEAYN